MIQHDDLIAIFAHGRARVWNTDSGEFRRSTSADSAAEMLLKGEWYEMYVGRAVQSTEIGADSHPALSRLGTQIMMQRARKFDLLRNPTLVTNRNLDLQVLM
jgi:hypothetical protein